MNEDYALPRRDPGADYLIRYQFRKDLPIFWGPNQRILEDKKYVEPSGWKDEESLVVPYVVRFIHDSGSIDSDLADGNTDDPGGGGGGDEPWELYLTQYNVCVINGPLYLSEGGSFGPTSLCIGLFPPTDINTVFSPTSYPAGLNQTIVFRYFDFDCELNPSRFIVATIGTLVGMGYLALNGFYTYWYWRKPLGSGGYDYYTTSACSTPDPSLCVGASAELKVTPTYFQEFPWTPDLNAPPCPS